LKEKALQNWQNIKYIKMKTRILLSFTNIFWDVWTFFLVFFNILFYLWIAIGKENYSVHILFLYEYLDSNIIIIVLLFNLIQLPTYVKNKIFSFIIYYKIQFFSIYSILYF